MSMITSRRNPLIKDLRALARDPSRRRAEGVFFCEGPHLLREALASGMRLERIVHTPAALDSDEIGGLVSDAASQSVEIARVDESCYTAFSLLRSPEGIAFIGRMPDWTARNLLNTGCRTVVISGVQDPGNAGAILRTAEAAGFSGAVFCGGVDPVHPALLRAAMGSAFRLPNASMDENSCLAACRSAGARILLADAGGGTRYTEADYSPPVAVVVGSEGKGASPAFERAADARIRIPLANGVESLNVGVAAALILFEAAR